MTIQNLNNRISRLSVVPILIFNADLCLADIPTKASYATSTTHDCIGYECKRSLYPEAKLEIKRNAISPSQFKSIVVKHINDIQTKETSFPGFNTTVKKKIPTTLSNKALHCHKAKPQKVLWRDSKQKSLQLKYRHDCWQYRVSPDKPNLHRHNSIERINDITYTVTITRTATTCSSSKMVVHATNFECIADNRNYSLLPLDEVVANKTVTITIDDEEIEFVLLEYDNDIILDSSITSIVDNQAPDDSNNDPAPTDPPSDDGDEPEHPDEQPDSENDDDDEDGQHDDEDNSEHDDDDHHDEHQNSEHPGSAHDDHS